MRVFLPLETSKIPSFDGIVPHWSPQARGRVGLGWICGREGVEGDYLIWVFENGGRIL